MAIISGILINGAGQPLPNVQIVLTALKTSSKVLNQSKALITTTSETGAYSINAQVGYYAVTVLRNGYSVEKVGCIKVYADSQNGTLNDYLLNPNESEISPEILAQIVEERKLTQQSASYAKNSANEAVETLENSVKKTGETSQKVDGTLDIKELKENGVRVYSPNNKPIANDVGALSTDGGIVGPISIQKADTPTLTIKDSRVAHYGQLFSNDYSFGFYSSNPLADGGAARIRYTYNTKLLEIGNCTLHYNRKEVYTKGGGEIEGDITITKTFAGVNFKTGAVSPYRIATDQTGENFLFYFPDGNNTVGTKLKYTRNTKTWNFENSAVTINGATVLKIGDAGLASITPTLNSNVSYLSNCGFFKLTPRDSSPVGSTGNLFGLSVMGSAYYGWDLLSNEYGRLFVRGIANGKVAKQSELITTANSTVDSNGFYKKASPIIRLFSNDDMEPLDGFEKSGCGLINSEANGVTATKIAVGHYEIHGSLGFAKEGWYITLPEDANGNKKLFAKYSTDENNVITIKTYTKKFDFEKCEVVAGEPQDITDGRWIDIRLEIPSVELS